MAKKLTRINLKRLKHGALYGGKTIRDKKGFAFKFVVTFNKEEVAKMVEALPELLRVRYRTYLKFYRDDQKVLTLFIFKYNSRAHASVVGSDLRWRNLRPANALDLGFLLPFAKEISNRTVIAIADPIRHVFNSSLGTYYPAMKFYKGKGERTAVETIYTANPLIRGRFCYLALYWSEPAEDISSL
jgi:hypothetical protein